MKWLDNFRQELREDYNNRLKEAKDQMKDFESEFNRFKTMKLNLKIPSDWYGPLKSLRDRIIKEMPKMIKNLGKAIDKNGSNVNEIEELLPDVDKLYSSLLVIHSLWLMDYFVFDEWGNENPFLWYYGNCNTIYERNKLITKMKKFQPLIKYKVWEENVLNPNFIRRETTFSEDKNIYRLPNPLEGIEEARRLYPEN